MSPWHDIPLYAGEGLLNFVCEIPKESAAKMEVATVRGLTRAAQKLKQLLSAARERARRSSCRAV